MGRLTLPALVEKYGHGNHADNVNIAFGLRPSGTIHLGNMMTMSLAAGLSRQIGPHQTRLDVTVCDIDLPDAVDWNIDDQGYAMHYKDIPDKHLCHETMADHAVENIRDFLNGLARETHINYELKNLSDVQRDPRFREGLKKILDAPGGMRLINPNLPEGCVLVYPLCPECEGSYTGNKRGKRNVYEGGVIHTFCTNPSCPVDDFDADVLDPDTGLSVHMFLDPLRDSTIPPYAQIHVFGGDYGLPHGQNRVVKFEKIEQLTRLASGTRSPDYLIGPLLYARDGSKMSKTKDNGLNIGQLKIFLGDALYERVYNFTMDFVGRGYNNIDFALVKEQLLSGGD